MQDQNLVEQPLLQEATLPSQLHRAQSQVTTTDLNQVLAPMDTNLPSTQE